MRKNLYSSYRVHYRNSIEVRKIVQSERATYRKNIIQTFEILRHNHKTLGDLIMQKLSERRLRMKHDVVS